MSNPTIGIRIDPKKIQLIRKVCKARGEDISDFVRRSIFLELAKLSYLNQDEKKALGFKIEVENNEHQGIAFFNKAGKSSKKDREIDEGS